jgi:alpha-ketoglutarate-dependent taurine dioxygenase
MFDFIKVHPVTGKKSLRLNYYATSEKSGAWIKKVYIDGIEQPDCSLIQTYIDYLLQFPELYIKHVWDTYDIAIYDNYSFIHGRTALVFNEGNNERKFYRINIDHMSTEDFNN